MNSELCLQSLVQGAVSAADALQQTELALEQAKPNPRWALVGCMALWKQNRYREAFNLYSAYAHHFQADGDALVIAGMCARRLPEHLSNAEDCFRAAIAIQPKRADAYYNLGNLLIDTDRHTESIIEYERSLKIQSNEPQVWHNYGIALREENRLSEAKRALQISIALDPSDGEVWCNLGIVEHAEKRFEISQRCYLKAISLDDQDSTSWVNLGMALLETLQPDTALEALEKGHTLKPSCPEAMFNLALTLLLLGNYEQGWRLYRSRFATKNFKHQIIPSQGPWIKNRNDLLALIKSQQHCLIWSEQGIGDSIQFCRYLPVLKAMGLNFSFSTRSSLSALLSHWVPEDCCIVDERKLPEELKVVPHAALLSLPYLLGSTLATIPMTTPYLQQPGPPPERLLVSEPPGGIAIGIAWASDPGNKAMYSQKSLPLPMLIQILNPAITNDLAQIHSLQVSTDSGQIDAYIHQPGIHNWSGKLNNFSDTAHVISQLDLVISVDTAVAHLAGALGIPTWLLLPANADFRWLTHRNDSPWYGTMRLFRQQEAGQWQNVMAEVQDALGEVLGLDLSRIGRL